MPEDQLNTINAKLDAILKCFQLSAVYYSQSSEQLRAILNQLEENHYE